MRALAVDVGDRRTGLAVGDTGSGIVTPAGVLEVPIGERLLAAVVEAVREHEPDVVVLGLPLNMDGTEGERAKVTRAFGVSLASATSVPVEYQDERLTSFEANDALAGSGRTRGQKKRVRDALAAAAILRDWLEARGD